MQYQLVQDYFFRGKSFKAINHLTFIDEVSVREANWNIQEGDCILDVGAGLGPYALTGLAVGAKRAFLWEPQQTNKLSEYEDNLKRNIALNGWEEKSVVYDYGLYGEKGFLDTEDYKNDNYQMTEWKASDYVFPVKTMDEWYEEDFLPRYGGERYNQVWMKIDIEGAERNMLEGAKKTIQALKPYILVENHSFIRGTMQGEVIEIVRSMDVHHACYSTPYHSVSHTLFIPKGSSFVPFDFDFENAIKETRAV